MVAVAAESYQAGLGRGMKQVDAWNASTCDWITAAIVSVCASSFDDLYLSSLCLQAHCHYIVLKAFYEAIQNSTMTTPSNIETVNALCTLFAAFGVVKYSGDFMMVCSACVCLCVGLADVIELRLLVDVNNANLDCCLSLSLSPSLSLSLSLHSGWLHDQ